MPQQLILTVIARDRPGVVEAVAEAVSFSEGNWIDSAMSRLGGEFAGIVRIQVPDDHVEGLTRALCDLAGEGISVTWRQAETGGGTIGTAAHLAVTGQDHAGIVRDVSRILAANGVSVEDLRTEVFSGSMSGEAMFSADAEVILPDGLDVDDLRDALELIAHDIMVDIDLKELEGQSN
ncbi:glycine cleavage system regulatory protein [Rhodobium orientis]|uniref:ACT domain-containing protein n=1 Tax=Rhodobium orientis TaxID=34017 RepID=A0A327JVA9_9HYPH|nr:ACT domain-containing protein [Rhodobium orientis]MBB4301223.1 glycine cleavage system regulatory protein [Rhodobium orientis]MBK5951185.1 hypothetical protein [Rhodobium orientis]RAI30011.1 hypothetical protein CH339_00300 [Rhodobium orientis]